MRRYAEDRGLAPENNATNAKIAARKRPLFVARLRWAIRGAFLLGICALLMHGCDGLFYHPSRTVWNAPGDFGLKHEDVFFTTRDGVKLHGWFLPAVVPANRSTSQSVAEAPSARGTVIHFHGNAENITNHIAFSAWLPMSGYNVLIFDYRGYGQSEGSITREGSILDGHAALDYVLSRPDIDPQRIFGFGHSLGGAVAVVVASERPELRSLVVDSTFGSYRRIAARHATRIFQFSSIGDWAGNMMVSAGRDPLDVVARLAPRPLMVIASGKDTICYPELGRELFEAAGEPKAFWLVEEAGHGEAVLVRPQEASRRIIEWFEQAR